MSEIKDVFKTTDIDLIEKEDDIIGDEPYHHSLAISYKDLLESNIYPDKNLREYFPWLNKDLSRKDKDRVTYLHFYGLLIVDIEIFKNIKQYKIPLPKEVIGDLYEDTECKSYLGFYINISSKHNTLFKLLNFFDKEGLVYTTFNLITKKIITNLDRWEYSINIKRIRRSVKKNTLERVKWMKIKNMKRDFRTGREKWREEENLTNILINCVYVQVTTGKYDNINLLVTLLRMCSCNLNMLYSDLFHSDINHKIQDLSSSE